MSFPVLLASCAMTMVQAGCGGCGVCGEAPLPAAATHIPRRRAAEH